MNTTDSDNEIIYNNQENYAKTHKVPCFASRHCYNCGMSLKDMLTKNQTIQEAIVWSANNLMTGCYNCGRTWCD